MEAQDMVCEKCGKEFTAIPESNSDYNSYCSRCFKLMIQRRDGVRRDEGNYRDW